MADFGKITKGPRSAARAEKVEKRLRRFIRDRQLERDDSMDEGLDAVLQSTARFLGSYGPEVSRLNKLSRTRLASMDAQQVNKLKTRAIEEMQTITRAELAETLDRFARGRIDTATLRSSLQDALRREALASAVIGVGGVGNLTEATLTAVRRQLTAAFDLLDGFIKDIDPRPVVKRDYARLAMFGNAAHTIAQTAQRQFKLDALAEDTQILEERRVLGGGEHCDDCVELAAQDWQEAGTLPPIGQDTVCGNSCKCTIETRIKGSGFYPAIDLAESQEVRS
jgi:hypothetical protein